MKPIILVLGFTLVYGAFPHRAQATPCSTSFNGSFINNDFSSKQVVTFTVRTSFLKNERGEHFQILEVDQRTAGNGPGTRWDQNIGATYPYEGKYTRQERTVTCDGENLKIETINYASNGSEKKMLEHITDTFTIYRQDSHVPGSEDKIVSGINHRQIRSEGDSNNFKEKYNSAWTRCGYIDGAFAPLCPM